MSLSIQQDARYEGHDYWHWSVWIEGSPEDLDAVDHVTYILHPTFKNPIREVKDRGNCFRLETAGWGAFTIKAKVFYRDGLTRILEHDLQLLYPDGTPTAA